MGLSQGVAQELSSDHAVCGYDRRGRGDGGDTAPDDPVREVEDLRAVVAEAGAPVTLCAFSSGVPLALAAAQHGVAVKKLALYKFLLVVDDLPVTGATGISAAGRCRTARGDGGPVPDHAGLVEGEADRAHPVLRPAVHGRCRGRQRDSGQPLRLGHHARSSFMRAARALSGCATAMPFSRR
ncbi:hypothetical protein GZH49_40435 [Nocardia terpenica]|uniref:hypothetical protein n=1 Tax=Nocardia terpenica TaxID=455432 RepID=UPI002FE1B5C5